MRLWLLGGWCVGWILTAPMAFGQGDPGSGYAAAQQALASGDVQGAARMLEELSRTNPKIAEIHATLGAVDFQRGAYRDALRELREAKRLKPALPKLDGLIAMSEAELGEFKEALPKLEETFRTSRDEPVKRMSGLELERVYTVLKRDGDAVKTALEMQRLFPNDPEVLYHNERIFGNYAYLTVQRLAAVAPDSLWRLQAQAEAQESQGSLLEAIAAYRKILAADPNHRGVHYRIGRCLRERARDSHHPKDLVEAMEAFEAELKIDPQSANAEYEVGELHRLAGEMEAAKSAFEAALRIYPNFPEANVGLGSVLMAMGRPADALPHLKLAITSDPEDEVSWYRLSQVERALGHKDQQQAAAKEFARLHHKEGETRMASVGDVSKQEVDAQAP